MCKPKQILMIYNKSMSKQGIEESTKLLRYVSQKGNDQNENIPRSF